MSFMRALIKIATKLVVLILAISKQSNKMKQQGIKIFFGCKCLSALFLRIVPDYLKNT
jgi:hypothetical protein